MSAFDELVGSRWPTEVPYLPIGDTRVSRKVLAGATPTSGVAAFWQQGTIPWMSSGEVNNGTITTTEKKITQAAYDSCSTKLLPSGTVVIALAGQGKTRGLVARTRIELCTNQSLAGVVVADSMDSDFLYYFLQTQYRQLRELSSGDGTRGGLNLQMIRSYKVPVPPLNVQKEVARALNAFQDLGAKLGEELMQRRIQMAHYRERLMRLDGVSGVRRAEIGSLATVVRGASPRPIQAFLTDAEDGVPWIKIGDVPSDGKYITTTGQMVTREGAAKSRLVRPGDFLLSNSMSFGRPYICQIEGAIHDGWLALADLSSELMPDFLYHLLRSESIQSEFTRRAGSSTVSNLNAEIVRSVTIPVPPLSEQKRVAETLDAFDTLINDQAVGLPAEITARRQQFEYYRDHLLAFDEAAA